MTTTRSERNTASGMEWVTKTTAAPVSAAMRTSSSCMPLAGHLVERAERLVHQQQGGALGERAGDGDPLLHAAGELGRAVPGELRQPDELEQLARPGTALAAVPAVQLKRQLDVGQDRPPIEQPGLLERDPVVLVEAGPPCGLAVDPHRRRWSAGRRSATMRSSVDLPQPDGPISDTNSPRSTRQVDVLAARGPSRGGPRKSWSPSQLDRGRLRRAVVGAHPPASVRWIAPQREVERR